MAGKGGNWGGGAAPPPNPRLRYHRAARRRSNAQFSPSNMFNRLFYRRATPQPPPAAEASWTDLSSLPGSPTSQTSRRSLLLNLARSDSDVLQSDPGSQQDEREQPLKEEEESGGLESGGNPFAYLSLRWRPSFLVRAPSLVFLGWLSGPCELQA